MQEQLTQLLEQAMNAVTAADTEDAVEDLRVHYLGKKGLLTEQLKALGQLPPAERPQMGQRLNQAKQTLQEAIQTCKQRLQTEARNRQLGSETLDVTLPGRGVRMGGLHPITRTLERLEALFTRMGFDLQGQFRRLRSKDGVHFLRHGNDKFERRFRSLETALPLG